jgi:hypothetical protein
MRLAILVCYKSQANISEYHTLWTQQLVIVRAVALTLLLTKFVMLSL